MLSLLFFFLMPAFALEDSTTEPLVKWGRQEIRVCWGDKDDVNRLALSERESLRKLMSTARAWSVPSTLRESLRDLVQTEYTAERTGIHFTGFKPCTNSTPIDLVIFLVSDSKNPMPMGSASVGENGVRGSNGGFVFRDRTGAAHAFIRIGTFDGMKIGMEDLARINILHELGHVAGLRHEHSRSTQAALDPNCKDVDLSEKPDRTSIHYSPYDPVSVMNYCWINRVAKKEGLADGEKIGLSQSDVHALKCLYGYSDDERSAKCARYY